MEDRMTVTAGIGRSGWTLALVWTGSVLLGAWVGIRNAPVWTPLLEAAARSSLRAGSCLIAASSALAMTVLGWLLAGRLAIWLICPAEALSFGMLLGGCSGLSGAPLMAALLLFLPLLKAPVLLMLGSAMLRGKESFSPPAVWKAIGALGILAAADAGLVSPFLTEVMNF